MRKGFGIEMHRQNIQQKNCQFVEQWDCEWLSFYETDASFKICLGGDNIYKCPVREEQFMQKFTLGASLD